MSRSNWNTAVSQILGESSAVNIAIQSSIDMSTMTLTANVEVYYTGNQTVSSNFINIAVLQHNVEGPQNGGTQYNPTAVLPNGNYNHQNMLRHLITGQWGDQITNITPGNFISQTYTWAIPSQIAGHPLSPMIDPLNLSVIGFVSENQQGPVLTATEVYPTVTFLCPCFITRARRRSQRDGRHMATSGEAALLALARSSEGHAATAQELGAPAATAQESAGPSVPLTYQEVRERAPLTYEEAREQALQEARAEGIMLVKADNASGFANVYERTNRPEPFQAEVKRAGKTVFLGYFKTPEQAALCVDHEARAFDVCG